MMTLLLSKGAKGEPLSRTLVSAIDGGVANLGIIKILTDEGADVNYNEGLPLEKSVELDSIFKMILDSRTLSQSSIARILSKVFQPRYFRTDRAKLVLQKFNDTAHLNTLMLAEVESGNNRIEVVSLLLEFGAEVDYQQGQTLVKAGEKQDVELLKLLLQKNQSSDSRNRAFLSSVGLVNGGHKLELMSLVLRAGVGQSFIDEALVAETAKTVSTGYLENVQLLVQLGASGDFNDGEALVASVSALNANLARVIIGTRPSSSTLTKAFRTLTRGSSTPMTIKTVETATVLLDAGIDQPAIDAALRGALDPDNQHWNGHSQELVDLLLQHNANVNTADGTCFLFAVHKDDIALLNKLLDHAPNFDTICSCLITSELGENTLVETLELCFRHPSAPPAMETSRRSGVSILFTAMQHYPQGRMLAKFLLNHGCTPSAVITYNLDPVIGPETLTSLLWALAPQNNMSTGVVLALLEAGGKLTLVET